MFKDINTIHFVYAIPPLRKITWSEKLSGIFKKKVSAVTEDYCWPDPVASPLSVSYNLIRSLNKLGRLKVYDITDTADIELGEKDIFIGHPYPEMASKASGKNHWETFDARQITNKVILKYPMDKRVFAIAPFNFDPGQIAWAFPLTEKLRTYIGICGDIWANNFENYFGRKHFNSFHQVNMAVERSDYPIVKASFNSPGQRSFIYIGRASEEKGLKQMIELKKLNPTLECATIGCRIEGWKCLLEWGNLDSKFMREIANSYDAIISFSTMDAQATTILEAMSWGFMVACTEETGYEHPSIFKLHLEDMEENLKVFEQMQKLDEQLLKKLQEQNFELLRKKYDWEVFTGRVKTIITSRKNEIADYERN